jgi:hypothetical protein
MAMFSPSDNEAEDKLSAFIGPTAVDQMVRQGINMCWISLPRDKRNVDEVERQVRRVVERALKDFRDDEAAFRREN